MGAFEKYRIELWRSFMQLWDDPNDYTQWVFIAGALLVSAIVGRVLARTVFAPGSQYPDLCQRFFQPSRKVGVFSILSALILWLGALSCHVIFPDGAPYIIVAAQVATAISVYRLVSALSKSRFIPNLLGVLMVIGFVLILFDALVPLIGLLRSLNLPLGDLQVSLWSLGSGIVSLFVLIWLASLSTRFIDSAVHQRKEVPPSIQVLISKLSRFVIYVVAIITALKIGGIDLGALTVFSGALGLGLGFGLQKVISNLISGIIILMDKSIKPGDVIEIDGTYGWINTLRTRYVSVITRDRKEYLIPNEDFITNPVVNWSFSDKNVRIGADVSVSYNTDLNIAMPLCVDAIREIPRVLTDPAPSCLLVGFGDSAINLQVRFWISDAHSGIADIRSAVLLAVWQKFREEGIEIPFPQRDLHIKTPILGGGAALGGGAGAAKD